MKKTKITRTTLSASALADSSTNDEKLGVSAQLYVALKESFQNPRKKKSLENVWRALEHLRAMKSDDFSIAAVARAIQALNLGGPQGQSIRNTPDGNDFRDLIRSYASEHGKPSGNNTAWSGDERIVGSIPDLRTASFVRELLNENRSKDRRIDMLKNLIGKLPPMDLASDIAAASAPPKALPPGCDTICDPGEIAAVVSFVKNIRESGDDFNLRFEPASGALLWKGGVFEVARPGFLSALTKIAGKEI